MADKDHIKASDAASKEDETKKEEKKEKEEVESEEESKEESKAKDEEEEEEKEEASITESDKPDETKGTEATPEEDNADADNNNEDDDDKPLSQLKHEIKSGKVASTPAPEDKPPTPPPKPPRPLSPFSQAHLTLSEAFPTVEPNVVRAVLVASSGLVDPAFNGLLSLSDPEYQLDENMISQQQQQVAVALSSMLAPPRPHGKPSGPSPASALRKTPAATRYRQAPAPAPAQPRAPARATPSDARLEHKAANRAAREASIEAALRSDSSQIEEDEKLARMLSAEYEAEQRGDRHVRYADTGRGTTYSDPQDNARGRRFRADDKGYTNDAFGNFADDGRSGPDHQYGYDYEYDEDDMYKERSFFDDDLPQLQANLQKGFTETKVKVNSWVENLRKKIDGDEGAPSVFSGLFGNNQNQQSSHPGASSGNQNNLEREYYNTRGYDKPQARRGGRPGRGFDRDPDMIDFEGIKMQDDTSDHDDYDPSTAPRLPRRPTGSGISSSTGHENNLKGDRGNKWEPLQPVTPDPVEDSSTSAKVEDVKEEAKEEDISSKKIPLKSETSEEDDPFFIGDSDDEEEADARDKKSDL